LRSGFHGYATLRHLSQGSAFVASNVVGSDFARGVDHSFIHLEIIEEMNEVAIKIAATNSGSFHGLSSGSETIEFRPLERGESCFQARQSETDR